MKRHKNNGFLVVLCVALMFSAISANVFAEHVGGGEADKSYPILNKTATKVADKEGVWDIELRIQGNDLPQTADIVLIIDSSGSMTYNNRLIKTKEAAKNFVNKALSENGKNYNKIALIKFSSTPTELCGLTKNKDELITKIDEINAFGGTFTQAAIYCAEEILKSSSATNKIIVLMTDGEPTYSYAPNFGFDWQNKDAVKREYDKYKDYLKDVEFDGKSIKVLSKDTPYQPKDQIIGKGNELISSLGKAKMLGPEIFINHGDRAIVQANHARKQGYEIYTIGLDITSYEDIIKAIGGGKAYFTDSSGIEGVYSEIADRFTYEVKDATLKDPIGEMFDIVDKDNIKVLNKNNEILDGGEINWIASEDDLDVDNVNGYFTAKLGNVSKAVSPIKIKYQVKIKNEAELGKLYPTNGETLLMYKDDLDKDCEKKFDVPEVSIDRNVIFTAKSDIKNYNGSEQKVSGYTHNLGKELQFDSIEAEGKGTEVGNYDVEFSSKPNIVTAKDGKKYRATYVKGKLEIVNKPDKPKTDKPKPEDQKPDKPKPEEPKTEEPKLEEPKPEEPKPEEPKPEVTPEIKPEPAPVPNPVPNNPRPAYPRNNVPNPNDPDSPSEITLIDENGVPLGNYVKKTNPDGTVQYVLADEDVPLGNMLPKTDGMGVYVYTLMGISMIALGSLLANKNVRKRKENE